MIDGISRWNFKTLSRSKDPQVVDLSDKQRGKVEKYEKALVIASESKVAAPYISNYFVKEGIVAEFQDGLVIEKPAGNIEYARNRAVHGEEAAVVAYRAAISELGVLPENRREELVLGIVAGNPGNIPSPCGNCRDVMIDGFGVDDGFEIVSGTAEGGLAMVVPMDMFTFDPQDQVDINSRSRKKVVDSLGMSKNDFLEIVSRTLKEGKRLANDAYATPTVKPERKYYATIATDKKLFHGAADVMVDYHPIHALRDAIRQARRENDSSMQSIVVVAEEPNVKPDVMYMDRQHSVEFKLQGELDSGHEKNPPVFLVGHDDGGKITTVHKTSINEWLPFAFNPRNFGPEFLQFLGDFYKGRGK